MQTYIPSSEFCDKDDRLVPEFADQEVWDLVGNAPFILALKDLIKKHNAWFGSMESFTLICLALVIAERETYERLSRKEPAPSVIIVDDTGGAPPDEGMSAPATWTPSMADE